MGRGYRVTRVAALFAGMCLIGSVQAAAQTAQYTTDDIQRGYRLYSSQCALCHGNNGDGIAGVNLAHQQFRRATTDADIRNTVSTGVPGAGMPPFKLQPAELSALVAYIRSGFDLGGTPFRLGDAARGKAIYNGKGACGTCHRVNGNGPRTAPDLSDIALLRQPAAIQRSIVEPNKGMLPINRPVRIVTRDGRTIRGRRLNEDTLTMQLIDENEKLVSLDKSQIQEFEAGNASPMPSYAGKLTDNEIADLLAYLVSLRGL